MKFHQWGMSPAIMSLSALFVLCQFHLLAQNDREENPFDGMRETLQSYIKDNKVIVDICAYEQEWRPDTRENSKAVMVMRAVVTHVHCGPANVGEHLEFIFLIEEPPRYISRHTSTVRGVLRTFFFDPEDAAVQRRHGEEVTIIEGDSHWGFNRGSDGEIDRRFEKMFSEELKTNVKFKGE